jgi:sulfur carrier protein
VRIVINGEPAELPDGSTAADVVSQVGVGAGVAVAVNDDVISRSSWAVTTLTPGDRVEILTAVQGG